MYVFKILLLGEGAVGKTSLGRNFLGRHFKNDYAPTIGADFAIKNMLIEFNSTTYDVHFQIWDIAGQQLFEKIRPSFYGGASGAFVVYDISRPDTLTKVTQWVNETLQYKSKSVVPIVLVGNKTDLRRSDISTTSRSDGEEVAKRVTLLCNIDQWQTPFIETSARTGENVTSAFEELGKQILRQVTG